MELSGETFSSILDSSDIQIDEIDLFKAVAAWGEEQIYKLGIVEDKTKVKKKYSI